MAKIRNRLNQNKCNIKEYLQTICMKYNKKPYLIDGIIGNSSMLTSIGSNGQIYRLWWPNIDIPQHIDEMKTGIFIFDKENHTIWIDNPKEQWSYNQYYEKDTNILISEAKNSKLNIFIKTTNFVVPNNDVLVRNFEIKNTGNEKINVQFILYSSLKIQENFLYNTTVFIEQEDGLFHYRNNYAFCISSPIKCSGYSTKNALEDAQNGKLNGGRVVLNSQGAISYFVTILPNEIQQIPIYFTCGHSLQEVIHKNKEIKSINYYRWLEITKNKDLQFLEQGKNIFIEDDEISTMYKRSLLVLKMLFDKKSGSIMAAPEVDETYSKCGGYDYCWGRDGMYVARAFMMAGFYGFARKFYLWTLTSQNKDGYWQQRHYHNGKLAPSWGFQVDEGGSILWGMWEYYKETKDTYFLYEVWQGVKSGAEFLVHFIDNNNLPKSCFDLWEEREGQHAYSSAAVYGGLIAASCIARELGYLQLGLVWKNIAANIKVSIEKLFWNEKSNRYYRTINEEISKEMYETEKQNGNVVYEIKDEKEYTIFYLKEDSIIDTSLLGLSEPFEVFYADNDKIQKTADSIEEKLFSQKVGGIKRYSNDKYIGGNPWIVTTLWLALFRIKQKQYKKAEKLLDWVIKHRTCLGLLSEQINKDNGTPAWVIPLNWSHAMFIVTVQILAARKKDFKRHSS